MKLGLRRNLFGPVLSHLKRKRHERRAKSATKELLQSTDEVFCTSDNILHDEQRNATEEKGESTRVDKVSAKQLQLRKYRINSIKSPSCNLNDDNDKSEVADQVPDKHRAIQNRTCQIGSRISQGSSHRKEKERTKPMTSTPSFASDDVSKEGVISSPSGSDIRSDDQEERDILVPEDDEELSFRGGNLGKNPQGSNLAEYGNSSPEESLPEDEEPTKVKSTVGIISRKHNATTKLVKYMSHREGSEKGFEVLLEDFCKFVAHCTVESDTDDHGTYKEPTTATTTKSEKESKQSEQDNSKKEETRDEVMSPNHIMTTNSRCRVVEPEAYVCVEDASDDDSKSATSVQSDKSSKDGNCIDVVSITRASPRVTSATPCMKRESTCICKCCGHLLEDSERVTRQSCSTDGSLGRKADTIEDCSEISRISSTASEFKRKAYQDSVQSEFRSNGQKTLQPLIVSVEKSPSSFSISTPTERTKPSETVMYTPVNMLFSMFSSLSTSNNPENKNNLVEVREDDETLHAKEGERGDDASRNDEIERPGESATTGEEMPALQPLIVALEDRPCSAQTSTPTASTKPPETATDTPINMLFSIFSSLSTKKNSDNKKDRVEVREDDETLQAKEGGDDANRNAEIERPEESAFSKRKGMSMISKIPSHARPPKHSGSKKTLSRYVTYSIQRVDSQSSLRSAPPRLSSDFPRHDAKVEKSEQLLSPSSLSQRKDNGWDGRE